MEKDEKKEKKEKVSSMVIYPYFNYDTCKLLCYL